MTFTFINFHNNTSQSITLEAWSEVKNGITSLKSTFVLPGEKLFVYSSVGEWIINDNEFYRIGKFRSQPCASGNYSWINQNEYECIYSETNENDIIGLMTFSEK